MTSHEDTSGLVPMGEQLAADGAREQLYERRPYWVQELVAQNYADEHEWPSNFSIMGANGADIGYNFGPHTSTALADELRAELGGALHVLDVGTGTGIPVAYHRDQGDIAQGITAFDYRQLNPIHLFKDDNISYVVGNAETLDAISELQPDYDLVMCRRTFHHLVDTLGTFEQMANRVAPGGMLCVDGFAFTDNDAECGVTAAHVLDAMRLSGFEPLESTPIDEQALTLPSLPAVVWRRRADAVTPVRFPIDYAQDSNGRLTYRLAA